MLKKRPVHKQYFDYLRMLSESKFWHMKRSCVVSAQMQFDQQKSRCEERKTLIKLWRFVLNGWV
jgi:hypothetical protein